MFVCRYMECTYVYLKIRSENLKLVRDIIWRYERWLESWWQNFSETAWPIEIFSRPSNISNICHIIVEGFCISIF